MEPDTKEISDLFDSYGFVERSGRAQTSQQSE